MCRARRIASLRQTVRVVVGVLVGRQAAIVAIVAAESVRRAPTPRATVRSSAVSALTVRVRSPVM